MAANTTTIFNFAKRAVDAGASEKISLVKRQRETWTGEGLPIVLYTEPAIFE